MWKRWDQKLQKEKNTHYTMKRERERTFEKWYPSGTDIFRLRLPSLEKPPAITMVSVSEDRLPSRLRVLTFGTGG